MRLWLGWQSEQAGPGARSEWGSICLEIAKQFKEDREKWFKACIDLLIKKAKEGQRITIVRPVLGGTAEQALKAFQLRLASLMLYEREYIPPDQGQDFADLLYAQVCGTELDECMVYVRRYLEFKTDFGALTNAFCHDACDYITTSKVTETEMNAVLLIVLPLLYPTHMIVASVFQDKKAYSYSYCLSYKTFVFLAARNHSKFIKHPRVLGRWNSRFIS